MKAFLVLLVIFSLCRVLNAAVTESMAEPDAAARAESHDPGAPAAEKSDRREGNEGIGERNGGPGETR